MGDAPNRFGFLRRPLLWLLLYSAMSVFGLYALWRIPVEVLPAFNYPQIDIKAAYPGATAGELETVVARPLEAQLLGLQNLNSVRSVMRNGMLIVTARFSLHTDSSMDLQAVNGAISRAQSSLPPGVRPVAEIMGNAINEVLDEAVDVPAGMSTARVLMAIRSNVEPALRALPGVQRVDAFGSGNAAIWIQPQPDALRHYGVSMTDIASAIQENVVLAPSGYLSIGHQDMELETRDLPSTIAAIGSLRVRAPHGMIPLRDLARIVRAAVPERSAELLNGRPSIGLIVFKQPGSSTLPVVREVTKTLAALGNQLPAGVTWVPVYDQGHLVYLIGHDLGLNLLIGGLLAVGVLFWILGLHRSVWLLALSIPLVLVISISVLHLAGQTLNLLTFGALSVGIGLLADDGIIVLESIYHRWEQGTTGFQGVWQGLKDLAAPDASGTFT
ncbi:MAG: efflux RND transporter permease subunit, partial [Gammaproteobacteria bacterium]|nr:efflux RND transporter permease subunit [Gammaproteobacteria bacterium]